MSFIFAFAKQIRTQARTATDHLNKFNFGFYRLEKYKIDDCRHINAGIQHINRNGDSEFLVFLKPGDQVICILDIVIHQLTVVCRIVRVHLMETFHDHFCVVMVVGEHDCFSDQLTAICFDTVSHEFFDDSLAGIFIVDDLEKTFLGNRKVWCRRFFNQILVDF